MIALVPNDWEEGWSTRKQFLTRLNHYFSVVWCNPPVNWREKWTLKNFLAPRRKTAAAELLVFEPGNTLPIFYRPAILANFLNRLRLRGAWRMLKRAGCKRIVLYIWRPEFASALKLHPHHLSVYHIDDEYTFSTQELPLGAREAEIIRDSDLVIIHSPALMEKKGGINPNTRWIPNGVDYQAFSRPQAVPQALASIRRPIFGYTGAIKKQLDYDLLLSVFKAKPEWSLVLVGSIEAIDGEQERLRALLALPNVHSLGYQPLQNMPAFVQAFDVCLLPYKVDGYTKFIYPLKLHEYLAAGRPVVGTPIRTLLDFKQHIRLVSDAAGWIEAMQHSLIPESDSARESRRREASSYDWNLLTQRIAKAVCQGLDGDYPKRLDAFLESRRPDAEKT